MVVVTVRGPSGPPLTYRFDQPVVTIGRSSANDIDLLDPAVSRLHLELRRQDNRWTVVDRGSRNGSFLRGGQLLKPEPLAPGDEIRLGDTVLVVGDADAGSHPAGVDRPTRPLAWSARGGSTHDGEPELVGRSAAMQSIDAFIERVAPTDATVLITGETGTGKELVARQLHRRSSRASGPFVVVNCPALPGSLLEAELFGVARGVATGVEPRPGRLETAARGTLLLDEIGDLSLQAQAQILRFLEAKTIDRIGSRKPVSVDVRILAATNHDLAADIRRGTFRLDLYHRMSSLHVILPPLRHRRSDIPLLVEHFLSRFGAARRTFSAEATGAMLAYAYPGNVRELERLVERVALLASGSMVTIGDLPEELRGAVPLGAGSTGATTVDIDTAAVLLARIVVGGESFWEVVHRPFLERRLTREVVARLVDRAHQQAGGTYRSMARLFGVEPELRRMLNFLYHNRLQVKRDAPGRLSS